MRIAREGESNGGTDQPPRCASKTIESRTHIDIPHVVRRVEALGTVSHAVRLEDRHIALGRRLVRILHVGQLIADDTVVTQDLVGTLLLEVLRRFVESWRVDADPEEKRARKSVRCVSEERLEDAEAWNEGEQVTM